MTARRREAALVALIIAVCGTGIWAATRSSYFSADDWLNLRLARDHGLTLDYLKLGYFGHFAPVHRFLDWVWSVRLQGDWGAYLAVMLTLHAIATVGMYVLLRVLGCGVALAAAATTLFASSVVWVRIIQWPASSEHVAWALAATAVSLAAAMLWLQRRSPWLLALAAGAMAAGLLSYEKPVLVVMYVVLLRYFVLAPSLQPRALLQRARGDWPLLAALGAVAVVYAGVVVLGDYSGTGPRPSARELAEFFGRGWIRGTGSLVIGQGSPEYADPIPLGLVIAAQVLLAVALVVSIRRRPGAWRAWAFLLVCWVVNVGLVGLNRIAAFGPGIALDPRYNAEMALLLPLALALAFASRPLAAPAAPTAAAALAPTRRLVPAVAAALGVALLAASCANAYRRVERSWQGGKSRAWVDRVRATAPAFEGPDGRVSVLDAAAPPDVVGINLPPFNQLSTVLPVVLRDRVDFDGGGARLAGVAPDGTFRRVRLRRLWGGPLPAMQCGPMHVTVTVDNGGFEGAGLVRVGGVTARRAASIPVLADKGAGFAVVPSAIRVLPGQDSGGTAADMTGLRTLELRVPADVCLRSVTTARPS